MIMSCRLKAEWRGDKSADEVALGSKAKFLWACSDCGHEYEARPSARSSKLSGCPKCAREACKDGPNRLGLLKDKRPDLVEEFDTEANPKCVTFLTCGSRFNASWICKLCGESYQKKVWERVKLNLGCPSCTNQERIGNRPVSETRLVEESKSIGTVGLPESDQPTAAVKGVGTESRGKLTKARDQKSQSMLQTQSDGRRGNSEQLVRKTRKASTLRANEAVAPSETSQTKMSNGNSRVVAEDAVWWCSLECLPFIREQNANSMHLSRMASSDSSEEWLNHWVSMSSWYITFFFVSQLGISSSLNGLICLCTILGSLQHRRDD